MPAAAAYATSDASGVWEEEADAWATDLSFVGGYTLMLAGGSEAAVEPTDDDPAAWASQGVFAESDSDEDDEALEEVDVEN